MEVVWLFFDRCPHGVGRLTYPKGCRGHKGALLCIWFYQASSRVTFYWWSLWFPVALWLMLPTACVCGFRPHSNPCIVLGRSHYKYKNRMYKNNAWHHPLPTHQHVDERTNMLFLLAPPMERGAYFAWVWAPVWARVVGYKKNKNLVLCVTEWPKLSSMSPVKWQNSVSFALCLVSHLMRQFKFVKTKDR